MIVFWLVSLLATSRASSSRPATTRPGLLPTSRLVAACRARGCPPPSRLALHNARKRRATRGPGRAGAAAARRAVLLFPRGRRASLFCRGDGVGELVLWRAAFFVVALCGSVVAANGCALVTGRRSPLWTAPIDAKPSLSFASRLNAMGCCAAQALVEPRRAALVRSRASRRASDEKNASEDGFASCGVTRTIRLEIEVALSRLSTARVLIRVA